MIDHLIESNLATLRIVVPDMQSTHGVMGPDILIVTPNSVEIMMVA